MVTYVSPDNRNIGVKRGYLSGKVYSDAAFDSIGLERLGVAISAQVSWKITSLEHYDPSDGFRIMDLFVQTQASGMLEFELEEQTARNLANWHQGVVGSRIYFLEQAIVSPLYYSVVFTDTSAVGPQWQYTFPKVVLTPKSGAKLDLIAKGSGDFGNMAFDAAILNDGPTATALGKTKCLGWLDGSEP